MAKRQKRKINSEKDAKNSLIELIRNHHPYFKTGDLSSILFPKQKAFYNDPARYKSAVCSRRAGKTISAAVAMIEKAKEYPGEIIPYIALTRQSAKNIMWPILENLNRLYQLQMKPTESALEMSISVNNKISTIFLIGADQKNFIDRLRGAKYPMAVIDEAGHFGRHIESLVDDVLDPATADFNGPLWLLGTPGPIPIGYFYDITTNPSLGFSTHHWTLLDNPYFPKPKLFLENLKKKKNWDENNPTYSREWKGLWVFDKDALIYKINEYNIFDEIKEKDIDWFYVIGVDVGYHDQTAFAVLAYSPDSPYVYAVEVKGFSEMIPSEIAIYLKGLIERYKPTNIVMDTGGLGKSIAEEMKKRFHIPIKPAEKKEKMSNIELLNGDFRENKTRILSSNVELIHQLRTLRKGDNGLEDPELPNDLNDATLYAWRECKHYVYERPLSKPKRGTNEEINQWWEQKEQELLNQKNQWKDPTADLLKI